jgi:hypothetical protein
VLANEPRALSRPAEHAPRPAPSASPETSLAREIRSLDAARAALDRGDGATAIAALDRHDRAFPHGVLESEAAVLRVEALLSAGERARAQTLARQLLARDPAGPHARRLEAVVRSPDGSRP